MGVAICLDVETTTRNKGNVYDPRNKLCSLVIKVISETSCDTYSFSAPWDVGRINELLNLSTLIIGFNLKFDLAWLRHEFGFLLVLPNRCYDCQYAEFLFSNQTWKYPDLETSCKQRGLGEKFDFIKENYWNKGIDTDQIPIEELLTYNVQDVEITYQLYLEQMKLFQGEQASKYRLFRLHMLDLPVLLDMEWNGLLYNKEKSLAKSHELQKQIDKLESELNELAGMQINWGSGDERSAFLYGGTVTREHRVPVGVYKTGAKTGQTRFRIVKDTTQFERRIEPLKGTEYAKGGVWSTDEPTLRSLKTNKLNQKILNWILERAKLEKLRGTYLEGLPKKMEDMGWGDYLHPSYNQCVAVTGRIASSNPNGQNLAPLAKQLIESRF